MNDNLTQLKDRREHYRTKMFWLLLEVAFIFGIPALVGFLIQQNLSDRGYSIVISLSPLLVAFVLSWIITVKRVNSVGKKLEAIESEIKNHHANT